MKKWKACCAGLTAAAVLVPSLPALAQAPVAAPVAVPVAPLPGAPVMPAVPAATPPTIWQKLGVSKEQRLACKYQFCRTQIGQLLNNATLPLAALSGGLLGNCCPAMPTPYDLAKPGAEGAAAAIKKDTLEAKARRAAVRYLATVDCHYWPEAEKALILALRGDKNECVRWEAAMALASGCCCTKPVLEALAITVSGSEADKRPSETSERVKSAAEGALHHCLACYEKVEVVPETAVTPTPRISERTPPPERTVVPVPVPVVPVPVVPGTPPPAPPALLPGMAAMDAETAQLAAYYDQVKTRPLAQVVADARRAAEKASKATPALPMMMTGSRDLFHLVASATGPHASAEPAMQDGVALKASHDLKPAAMTTASQTPSEPSGTKLLPMRSAAASVTAMEVLPASAGTGTMSMQPMSPSTTSMKMGSSSSTMVMPAVSAPMSMTSSTTMRAPLMDSKSTAMTLPGYPSAPGTAAVPMTTPTMASVSAASLAAGSASEPNAFGSARQAGTSYGGNAFSAITPPPPPASRWPAPSAAPTNRYAAANVVQASGSNPEVQPLITVLRTSSFASQRQWAVEMLAASDPRKNPEAVTALVSAASQDSSGMVRAACVRSLSRMNLETPQVVNAFQLLRDDIDPQVRREANQALTQMGTRQAQALQRP